MPGGPPTRWAATGTTPGTMQPGQADESEEELVDEEVDSDLLSEEDSDSEVDSEEEGEEIPPVPAAGRGRGRGRGAPKPAAAAGGGKKPAAARAPKAAGAAKYTWVDAEKHKWMPRAALAGSALPTLASSLQRCRRRRQLRRLRLGAGGARDAGVGSCW